MQDANSNPRPSLRHDPYLNAHVRHVQWLAISAFSIMALVATTSRFETGSIKNESREVQWVVSAMSIVLAVSAFSVFAHFALKNWFVGTLIEGALSVLTTAVWAAALPYIMDPDYSLAVTSRYEDISNPILYFFSWVAFISSYFVMMGTLFKCYSNRRPSAFSGSSSLHWLWVGLVLTSFVVMMSANRMLVEGHCCKVNEDSDPPRDWSDPTLPTKEFCNRLKVATGLGTASAVLSFAWSLINMFLVDKTNDTMLVLDMYVVGALLALWTFGTTWLTFNETKSPAADLCNLFFFTWGSWILALVMSVNSVKYIVTSMAIECSDIPDVEARAPDNVQTDDKTFGHTVAFIETDGATHATHDDKQGDVEESQSGSQDPKG